MKNSSLKISPYICTALLIFLFFVGYYLVSDVFQLVDQVIFPPLSKIFTVFIQSLPKLLSSVFSSIKLLLPAYIIATVCGIGLGLIIGMNPFLNQMAKPIIFALNPIPPAMITPYIIAVFPSFYSASVAIIFIACFWPLLNGTITGISHINEKFLQNAAFLELTGFKKIFHIILPAASPHILSGGAMSLTFSFIMLAVAEMFATDSGIGYFIQYYADFADYARVIAGIMFLALFTTLIMLIYTIFRNRLLFWVTK